MKDKNTIVNMSAAGLSTLLPFRRQLHPRATAKTYHGHRSAGVELAIWRRREKKYFPEGFWHYQRILSFMQQF